MSFTDYPFTPSEYILLNADRFASEAGKKDRFALILSEGYVSGTNLASILISSAILANEAENALKVELKEEKSFLGIHRSSKVTLTPDGVPPNWNSYTLESAILYSAGQLHSSHLDHSVYGTVYNLLHLKGDANNPWISIASLVEWGLASSNWLIPVEGDAAAAFSIPFICPGKVRDLVISQPLDPYVHLLMSAKENNPVMWNMMQAEINQAFQDFKGS